MGESIEPGKDVVSHKTIPESSLSSAVVIAEPTARDLALELSSSMGLEIIYPELRIFSDGESKIRITENLKNRRCIVVQSICPPQVDRHIIQTLMILKKCVDDSAKDVSLVIPYMAYARQDRVFLSGEVVTIGLLAKLFKTFGAKRMITVDIHSSQALTYFDREMNSVNISAVPLLAQYAIDKLRITKDDSITVVPDEGGIDRAEFLARLINNNIIRMRKIRDRHTGEVFSDYVSSGDRGQVRGRNIVLVDDIISTGNTIIKAAQVLKSDGCRDIIAMCTHALLTTESTERLRSAGVSKIVTTNSIPRAARTDSFVEVINLSPILVQAVSKIFVT
jgi:ribose-phosphate pyrophosphokinase